MLFHNRAVCVLGAFSLVAQLLAPISALAQNNIGGQAPLTGLKLAPRAALSSLSLANSVTLNATSYTALLQGLKIKQQIPYASIRSNRVLQLGNVQLNMTPLLENPRSLPNVAQKLRSIPALVQAVADETQIHEVEQGLLIHHVMSYQIKAGVCNDAGQRAKLGQTGVHCATQLTDATRAAAFANKGDAHYVADPAKRAQKLALAIQQSESARITIDQYAADFRVMLKDPAERAKVEAEIGPAATAKLDTLNDDQLKTELVNTGETKIEQTMFVPKASALNPAFLDKLKLAPPHLPKINQDVSISHDLPPFIFLTGFTLGRDYEWSQRVETTISWCIAGCKKTYFAEVYAGFNYGFGLRFPVSMGGTYNYTKTNSGTDATVTPVFKPIDGSEDDYRAAGLPSEKVFGGKEIVAQVGGTAGLKTHIPIYPDVSASFSPQVDFTQYLPEPLKGGNFTPPSVGQSVNVNKFFKEIDLIGERANFGIVAARIAPGLKINLQSDALSFTLHDNEANTDTLVTNSSQLVHLGINANDNSSSFSLGNPVYKLGFDITPGIDAILSIQLGVWSNDWDFPVWFPQLTIKLPPDGASFSCHAETQCSRNYHMGPAVATVSAGASSGFKGSLKDWGKDFDAYWAARCADDICKFAVTIPRFGAIADGNTMFNALPEDQRLKLDAATQNTPVVFGTDNLYHMDQKFTSADKVAQSMVDDSKYRVKATGLGQNLIKIGATEYVKQCSDQQCYNEFKSIYDQESVAFDYQVKTNPAASLAELMSPVTSQYNPQYIKAVADSKARAKAAAVGIVLRIKPLNSGNAATPLLPRVNIK